MKLYTGDLSPYSAKVRMQIYAMGITDIEFDLPVAEFFSGKPTQRNPTGYKCNFETNFKQERLSQAIDSFAG